MNTKTLSYRNLCTSADEIIQNVSLTRQEKADWYDKQKKFLTHALLVWTTKLGWKEDSLCWEFENLNLALRNLMSFWPKEVYDKLIWDKDAIIFEVFHTGIISSEYCLSEEVQKLTPESMRKYIKGETKKLSQLKARCHGVALA